MELSTEKKAIVLARSGDKSTALSEINIEKSKKYQGREESDKFSQERNNLYKVPLVVTNKNEVETSPDQRPGGAALKHTGIRKYVNNGKIMTISKLR